MITPPAGVYCVWTTQAGEAISHTRTNPSGLVDCQKQSTVLQVNVDPVVSALLALWGRKTELISACAGNCEAAEADMTSFYSNEKWLPALHQNVSYCETYKSTDTYTGSRAQQSAWVWMNHTNYTYMASLYDRLIIQASWMYAPVLLLCFLIVCNSVN